MTGIETFSQRCRACAALSGRGTHDSGLTKDMMQSPKVRPAEGLMAMMFQPWVRGEGRKERDEALLSESLEEGKRASGLVSCMVLFFSLHLSHCFSVGER